MAKELPYFRFTSQEWQNGDISLESYEHKGLFIDICAYYWVKDCSLTKAMLEKRFSNAGELLNNLLFLEILQHDEKSDFIHISFLDSQFDMLSEARKRRQEAGSKGGKQRSSNAKAKPEQCSSYKDKDKDKDKYKDKDGLEKPIIPKNGNQIKKYDLQFVRSDFVELVNKFIEHRSKKEKPFENSYGVQNFYNELMRLSGFEKSKAEELVNHAIANNWNSVYEIKTGAQKNNNQRIQHDTDF